MSYVLDSTDGKYNWFEDGQGDINDIPVEAVGKIKASKVVPGLDGQSIIDDLRNGRGGTVSSGEDFDVYWNTSQYGGGTGGTVNTTRTFASIEQQFKNLSIKDPEYLRWVDALKKTEFGSAFPKKKTPTKGQVISAL